MRVVQLKADNFKRLQAVEITPNGDVVMIGGKNGAGKSSVLDAIYVALVGRSANPPRPVRAGEERATIQLDLGEFVVTRTFNVKDGDRYTDTLKVETPDGLRYGRAQETLDALLGEIGFDPFAFIQMKPKDQLATLLDMVPLSVDLDELAEADRTDFANRTLVNRDVASLTAQVAAIPEEEVPGDTPDRAFLTDALAKASETNAGIERERASRADQQRTVEDRKARVAGLLNDIQSWRDLIASAEDDIEMLNKGTAEREADLAALPALAAPVDAEDLHRQLTEADATLARIDRQNRRAGLVEQRAAKEAESAALSAALEGREKDRRAALAKAKMPVEGLGFSVDEQGKAFITWEGLPFVDDQISTAVQLRVSTAIAMAANPRLRVLRVKDGSLLDEDSMKLLAEMAAAEDFQLWVEVVGEGGVGFILEDGHLRGHLVDATEEKPAKAKPAKKAEKPDGALL